MFPSLNPKRLILAGAIAVSALSYSIETAWGWGAEGHQTIALIAADNLSPAAKRQVEQLLGTDDSASGMVVASTWADEIRRQRPETAPWHFTDIPIGSSGYDGQRDCPRDDCSIIQIDKEEAILRDRQLLAPVRAEALRFLIHFIGDLHQPLHSADNHDRGGNGVRIIIGNRYTNLHAVWDVDTVRALGRSPEEVSRMLEREISDQDRTAWQHGSTVDWANESFRIANQDVYPTVGDTEVGRAPIILPNDYARDQSAVVKVQLEKAGIRLAWVLNDILR